jgi:aminoglycoside phosphotransferase family enzyme
MPDTDEDRQRRLLEAWCRPGTLGPGRAELIETHISRVFLAGDFAWKIKKPINTGFLDFSTLQARHHFCREELRLNGRLAPDIYLGVDAICGSPEATVLVGDGEEGAEGAFEYAVKMARFPQACQADRMLAVGELRRDHMDELARTLASFHGAIHRATPADSHGTPERINAPMRCNFDLIRRALGGRPETLLLDALEAWS